LGLPEIVVEGDGTNISISAGDTKNSSMNDYKENVEASESVFKHIFKVDNMKMMMLQYNVEISTKGISKFSTEDGKATYYIATESRS
jgi:hypothetical protein